MTDRTLMHIDLDAFFVSVEQALDPELKGKPVVVGGRPGGRGVIAAASYEARKYGLHSAMPVSTAVRLCPQAIFIRGDFSRYRDYSRRFMAILADFSPFLEPGGLDEAYLDVTGFESLHGTIRQMALSIKDRIRNELDITGSIGIASSKIVAKIASDFEKPDGLTEVKTGEEAAFLAPLGAGRMPGIGKKTEQTLKRLGITTLGKLANTPPETLRSYFGVHGVWLRDAARGVDPRPVEPPGTAKSISRETTFGEDSSDREFLKATLRYQAERVGADLRKRGLQARCITLKLRYSDFTTITRNRTLPQSTDGDKEIFSSGSELMEKALSNKSQPVRLIGIGVSRLTEPGGQLSMLEMKDRRLEQLDRVIDGIRDKYGFGSIRTGQTIRLGDLSLMKKPDEVPSADE